jgi:hypothetical protein
MDATMPEPAATDPRLNERWQSLVDILYLSQVTFLYVFSAVYPVVGLFFGILFLSGSISAKGKRIGKVCLILGIINAALTILLMIVVLALGLAGALSGIGKD